MWDEAVARARQGDIAAYEEVVRRAATLVRACLALHVRDAETVNDLAQETFLYAYEHLAEYAPGTDFPAWLKTIARTQALKHWRSRQRKQAAHNRYMAAIQDRLAARAEALEEREPVETLLAKLRRCLEKVSGHARELVRLRYFENRPAREIAGLQGKPVNQVNVALFRVRRALGQCVEGTSS